QGGRSPAWISRGTVCSETGTDELAIDSSAKLRAMRIGRSIAVARRAACRLCCRSKRRPRRAIMRADFSTSHQLEGKEMASHASTLLDLLAAGQASAPAISAPGLTPLDYGNLRAFVHQMQGVLRSLGVAQGDRVAIVLPNGPEMAVAFLAVASAATAAPLNPAYKAEEF